MRHLAPVVVSVLDDHTTLGSPNGADTPPLSPPPVAAVAEATATKPAHPVAKATREACTTLMGADTASAPDEPAEDDLQALEALMQLRGDVKGGPIVAPPPPPHPVVPPYGACGFG